MKTSGAILRKLSLCGLAGLASQIDLLVDDALAWPALQRAISAANCLTTARATGSGGPGCEKSFPVRQHHFPGGPEDKARNCLLFSADFHHTLASLVDAELFECHDASVLNDAFSYGRLCMGNAMRGADARLILSVCKSLVIQVAAGRVNGPDIRY